MDLDTVKTLKRKLDKKGVFKVTNKDEEYFRMCLLAYQIQYKHNLKLLSLDYRALYKQAVEIHKLQFF